MYKILGGGSNLGALGQYIRNLPSSSNYIINNSGGAAPSSFKDW